MISQHDIDAMKDDEPVKDACPDGGTCHHGCEGPCWRVSNCCPLSGVFEGDAWPPEVVAANPRR